MIILILMFFVAPLFAENSITLPKGRFRFRAKPIFSSNITEQYNRYKEGQSLAQKFDKELDAATMAKIDSDTGNFMKTNNIAPLGKYAPGLELSSLVVGTALEYGVTNDLTLGVIMPIVTGNSKFSLDFQRSAMGQVGQFGKTDFVKAAEQAAIKYGYHPFENWNQTGLGDIELGVKYRLVNALDWAVATKAGVRLPTGLVDDPDHLTDFGFGDGQTDLGATLLVDYTGVPNILFNLMTKYTAQLPDHQILRVPDEGDIFTNKIENIKRNLGDRFDAALYGEYTLFKNFNFNASYNYFTKKGDTYKSALGYNDYGLMLNTYQMGQTIDLGAGFSTLPWVREGAFAIPMDLGVNFQFPTIGQNIVKSTALNFEYKVYF